MNNRRILSSPNYMVSCYFQEARTILSGLQQEKQGSDCVPVKIAIVVLLSVAALEAFLNTYFYIYAKSINNPSFVQEVQTGRKKRNFISIIEKIVEWPQKAFNKTIKRNTTVYRNAHKVIKIRNKITHYKTTDETFEINKLRVKGLQNITYFERLSLEDGICSVKSCESIIGEIGLLGGSDRDSFIHLWTGKMCK